MFCRYALRTTEPDAARRFYSEAIGLSLPNGSSEGSILEAWPLHERARARGAPPHWLGHIAVNDVDRKADRLIELGAERLSPTVQASDGARFATLRDPFGAVIALRDGAPRPARGPVGWHQLHVRDVERAVRVYAELFGWVQRNTIEVPDPVGGHRLFAWREGGEIVGSMGNTARWPGVHTHWLFHFLVSDIEAKVDRVRAHGGNAHNPVKLSNGIALSACEDPQGAAFGLAASG